MKLKKPLLFLWIAVLLAITSCASSSGSSSPSPKEAESVPTPEFTAKIVASTSWTAWIAKAAGAKKVDILSPVELKHPPEYDFRPGDLEKVKSADLVIYAGYEPFMKKLLEAVAVEESKKQIIATENTPEALKKQTRLLAEKLSTVDAQKAWETELDRITSSLLAEAKEKGLSGKRAVVSKHMLPFAKWIGIQVVGEFGPEEPGAGRVGELAALKPDLIIDNYHNPQGKTIAEMAKAKRVELRNFPGPEHNGILDLLKDNAGKLY